jgi:hypothetical protein
MNITPSSLLTLEAYSKIRQSSQARAIAHRRLRSVHLGDHVTLQFEDEHTVRRQIQEMLHIEKIFDEEGIQSEIDAYAALVPDGSNWKATMLIEYPDVHERKRELARLIGVEDRMFVEVGAMPASMPLPRNPSAAPTRRPRRCISCASSSARHSALRSAPARR